MRLQILIDMNLSPLWVDFFKKHKIKSLHWSTVGDHHASDDFIMAWAREHKKVVFTNDLDFGTLLALTRSNSPSVIQLRTQNLMPEHLGKTLIAVLKKYELQLEHGSLIVLDDNADRLRILPLK